MPSLLNHHPATSETAAPRRAPVTVVEWWHWFGRQAGLEFPRPQPVAPAAMPSPYRQLLAHGQDMTSTLERFYQTRLGLRALRRERHGPFYVREVVLTTAGGQPVEYGVIGVRLNAFPPAVREEILAERLPLGRLLQDHEQPCICRPQEFYRIAPHPYLSAQLAEHMKPEAYYGRRNLLLNAEHRLLADVMEILSPLAGQTRGPLPQDYSACFGQVMTEET
jgi:chorismate-pyruvate lyase